MASKTQLPANPASASATPSSLEILQEISFTRPLENFGKKLGDSNLANQAQRTQFNRALSDLLPEVAQVRTSLAKWRAAINETPGIQRSVSEQMQRLDNLNYAVVRRSELLQRHRGILHSENAGNSSSIKPQEVKPSDTSSQVPSTQSAVFKK